MQRIERELGFDDAGITGNATLLAYFTSDINLALDDALAIILPASGTWKYDDSNFTDYPTISTNIVSGRRDYPFITDGSSNLILDIYKVFVANSAGRYIEIYPVDIESGMGDLIVPISGVIGGSQTSLSTFTDGQNTTGLPIRYDKQANALFLDPIPNYNYTLGLKVYVNREGSYFTVSDTTKKPGIAGLFHEYFVVSPCYKYLSIKNPKLATSYLERKLTIEKKMGEYYGRRSRDERKRLIANVESAE